MTPASGLAWLFVFVAGPALCAALLVLPERGGTTVAIAAAAAAAMAAALWLDRGGADPLAALAGLWLGWVLAVAALTRALRRRPDLPRRWVTVAGFLVTTLPWFGLAAAQFLGA